MAGVLTDMSDALAANVEAASPSVVRVDARSRLAASGVVWAPDLVVTAHHVVEQEENIGIGLPDGGKASATLVGRDPTTDLAVLRIQEGNLTPLPVADDGLVRVGHIVLGLGRPGQKIRATMGIVSALAEGWRSPLGGKLDCYLQTDLTMYPGFSGGPLVDGEGRSLGINTSALMRGVSMVVPNVTIKGVVDALLSHGRIRRGYLGVTSQPIRLPQAQSSSLGQDTGSLLVSVEPGGPADKGGLFLGDTIVGMAGQPVRQLEDLLALLGGDSAGTVADLRILRGGQLLDLKVTIGERE